jgi:hypothetical protein
MKSERQHQYYKPAIAHNPQTLHTISHSYDKFSKISSNVFQSPRSKNYITSYNKKYLYLYVGSFNIAVEL